MVGAKEIFEAFAIPGKAALKLSPSRTVRANIAVPPSPGSIDEDAIFATAIGTARTKNVWDAAREAKRMAEGTADTEVKKNTKYVLPLWHDLADLIDPEGREYRKRAEETAEWNRPQLHQYYMNGKDGGWMSMATVTRDVVAKRVAEEDMRPSWEDDEWMEVTRKPRTTPGGYGGGGPSGRRGRGGRRTRRR